MSSIPDNDPLLELRRKSMSLSIEQLKDLYQNDYDMLVGVFMIESSGEEDPFAMTQIWKRWAPLIREKLFMEVLEKATLQMEEAAPSEFQKTVVETMRNTAREMSLMSEESLDRHFDDRSDPHQFHNTMTSGQGQAEFNMGVEASAQGDLVASNIHYERAFNAFKSTGDNSMMARSIFQVANNVARAGHQEEAQKQYRIAADMFGQLGDTVNLGLAQHNVGHSIFTTGDFKRAYQYAARGMQVLDLSKPGADKVARMCAHLMLRITRSLPDQDQVDNYRSMMQALEGANLQIELGRCYLEMGTTLAQLSRDEEAYEAATQGFKLMTSSGASQEEMRWAMTAHAMISQLTGRPIEEWMATANEELGTPSEVSRLGDMCHRLVLDVVSGKLGLQQARNLLHEEHNRKPFDPEGVSALEADTRGIISQIERVPVDALKKFETDIFLLLFVAELTDSHGAQSALYLSLGRIYDQLGRSTEAAEAFDSGAELARVSGNIEFHITMVVNRAVALRRAGKWSAAIDLLRTLLPDLQTLDATVRRPEIYQELANTYRQQQMLAEAEDAALNGVRILAESDAPVPAMVRHNLRIEAELNTTLGIVHRFTNRYASAEKHYSRSLQLYRELENHEEEAHALGGLASVRSDIQDFAGGFRLYNLSYQLIEHLPPNQSHSFIYTGRAICLLNVNQFAEARRMASLSLQVNPPVEQAAQCLCVLMETATSDSERADARQQAEKLLEADPAPMVQLPILWRLLQQDDLPTDRRDDLQLRLRRINDSLDGLQQAYQYLNLSDLHDGTEAGRKAAIEDLDRCMELIEGVAANNPTYEIQRSIFATSSNAAQRLLQLQPEDSRTSLEIVLRAKARATLHQSFHAALTLEELQAQLARQEAPVLLVEMYTLPTASIIHFVTAAGIQGVEHIPVTFEVLLEENEIISKLGDSDHFIEAWKSKTWERVSSLFVQALAKYVQPGQMVCIIPAGFWHFLPLHACLLNGRPLIESHPIFYGPSSSILSRPGDAQRHLRQCLAIGVGFEKEAEAERVANRFGAAAVSGDSAKTDVISMSQEAEWVANRFGGTVVLENSAIASVITMSMENTDVDVVHFSCHGAYNPWRGSESGLALAHNSWLTPKLLEQGTTAADLVTLAACETAFDFVTAGNDLLGLDQAFLNMGAVSVMGTLWKVESVSTNHFVMAFYEQLTGAPGAGAKRMSKAHALQAAVAKVRKEEQFDHPYFWAAFKLTGGWR